MGFIRTKQLSELGFELHCGLVAKCRVQALDVVDIFYEPRQPGLESSKVS